MTDAAGFRAGMRRLAASVNVVTSRHDGVRGGLTATAVMSLTAEPPQLGVAVNRNAGAFPLLHGSGCFAVNILAETQADIAILFATGEEEARERRFAAGTWSTARNGAPFLDGAAANFGCRVVQRVELSTHVLFIGAVDEVRLGPVAAALLHADGGWAGLAPLAA